MVVVTGAAGFIGSVVVGQLNAAGYSELALVDRWGRQAQKPNFIAKRFVELVDRDVFVEWAENHASRIQAVLHLGARTDTTEARTEIFEHLNLNYSKQVWQLCTRHQIPLVYASSAATYGNGDQGFSDDPEVFVRLKPQNPYGQSKHDFDVWALGQPEAPFFWAGLKFFNVYGPNEYHKGRMASVVFHAFNQIKETGQMKLFKSHRPDCENGEQSRDFIYVKDVAQVVLWLMETRPQSGIFNLGTGISRSFNDLAKCVFGAVGLGPDIRYIDIPADIRAGYQYFTQANMARLRGAGYEPPFIALESGIDDYVRNYLLGGEYA